MDCTACSDCAPLLGLKPFCSGEGEHHRTTGAVTARFRGESAKVLGRPAGDTPAPGVTQPRTNVKPPADLAAERPDAAPRRVDHVLRAAAHAAVLLATVAFVLVYCVWMPARAQFAPRFELASVIVIANPLLELRAPDVTGVFRAVRPLPPGARVQKGELLGVIEVPQLDVDEQRVSLELRSLQARQLRLDQRAAFGEMTAQEAREALDLAGRVEAVAQTLAHLHSVRSQLRVCAPAAGIVQQGLAATVGVVPHHAIASLYPDGGELLVEVSGPMEVLNALQRAGHVNAVFSGPDGEAEVAAIPVLSSVRHFTKSVDGRREETWGTVQCVPEFVPAGLRSPGCIGKLRS